MPDLHARHRIIDSNCYLGHWPTRNVGLGTAESLVKLAQENGVDLCLVSAFDAIFHKDYLAANQRMMKELEEFRGKLLGVPIENPQSPVSGSLPPAVVRLVPSYHGYTVLSKRCQRFLRQCESCGTTVFVSLRMRDERLSHPLLRLRPSRVMDLAHVLSKVPGLDVVVNNAKSNEIDELLSRGMERVRASCDWSFPIGFIEKIVDRCGDDNLVYGSNAPLHYYRSSLLQVLMADIPEKSKAKILGHNIGRILRSSHASVSS